MHPTTVYELHIFKDVDNTSWTNPQVHTFQLSENAALPVIRNNESKGGISNLRRCSPEQLSFLQSHLAAKNAVLKSAREAEMKVYKETEARLKKEAQKKKEKEKEERKKWELEIREKALKLNEQKEDEKKDNEDKTPEEEENGGDNNSQPTHPFNPIPPPPPPPFSSYRGPANFPNQFHGGRDRSTTPLYVCPPNPSNYAFPPPPPPQVFRNYARPPPPQLESDWNLESVDLDLIPIVARLKVKKLKDSSIDSKNRHIGHCDYDYPRRGNTRLPRIAYQLADSAKVEIAVLYSRTAMTSAPNVPGRRGREEAIFYGSESGSVYEYNSDVDMEEILARKEEGDDEESEEGEEEEDGNNAEEDLEIVEGFNHCHPLTDSMSRCCLEKEC